MFLTSRLPYPPFRGDKLRVFNLLRRVARNHKVSLFSLIQKREEVELAKGLEPYCNEIRLMYKPKWSSFLSCGLAVFNGLPFQIAYFQSRRADRMIQDFIKSWRPDLLHVHYIRMAQYAHGLRDIPRVIDLTDSFSLYLDRRSQMTRNPLKQIALRVEYGRMRNYESMIGEFDRGLVCSPVDRDQLSERAPHASLVLLPNGVDLDTFTHDKTTKPDPFRIIFTGNMSYFPNADAAVYFVREILPLIHSRIPQATFIIAGQSPPKRVRDLADERIVVTGLVSDLAREYMKSAVAVSPVRLGSGTLNKIIEPLALGVPVVTGTTGIAGLNLINGEHVLIADDPLEFANNVVRVLNEPALRDRLSKAGPAAVCERFSWDTIALQLEAVYKDTLERRSN